MAKANEQVDLSTPISLSAADLVTLLANLQKEGSKSIADALASSLEKLTPGYKTPEQLENEKGWREQMRQNEIAKIRRLKSTQKICAHESGLNGNRRNGEGSFFVAKLPTGEYFGICCYCLKTISSLIPDHQPYFRKVNGTIGEAGQTNSTADPLKVQLARFTPDQQKQILAAREKWLLEQAPKSQEEDLVESVI